MKLDGKIALVTGSGRGIGEAIALRLARDGAHIVLNDLNEENANKVAKKIEALGRKSCTIIADVSQRDEVFHMVEQAVGHFGRLDIMVNNAGIAQVKPVEEITPEELDQIFRINVFAVIYGIQAAAKQMKIQGGGKIISACSIAGHKGFALLGAYSATKFSVRALTQAAAQELAQFGITVNAYCPGVVGTEMWDLVDERLGQYLGLEKGEALKKFSQDILLGRVERPEDVANFVSYLASEDADYMTGQSVLIDGGMLFS
jgi:meso-butanediol dehydrogenase/(S,S)-butanediol dehydrogenase/diacetyl reductase